jgi:hypothetical protein
MKTDELLKHAKENKDESSISSAEKDFADENKSRKVFASLKTKILRIGEWNEHALMSSYALFDGAGKESADEKIAVGKFIRIHLKASGKYDWVRVIDFDETPDEFVMTVQPTFDPTAKAEEKSVVSHFFTDESTNNFCLFRKGQNIGLYVIGLNEKQNTTETGSALETIRNVAVNAATYLGIQNSEWEKFCHHFLEDAAENNSDG